MAEPDKSKSSSRSSRVKKRIEAQLEAAEKARKKQLFRQRIDVARQGVKNYQLKKHSDAVVAFKSYLRILEDHKGVSEGNLSPALFDLKEDLPELLLLSGVYWDLMKLYDRTKSEGLNREFKLYTEKFIQFSKGMPFQVLSAETLRKYIWTEKPVHVAEFKNAYKLLGGSNCFIASSLMDVSHPDTIVRLQRFRDEVLQKSSAGQTFISWYYRMGPQIALRLDRMPKSVRRLTAKGLDVLASLLA